MKRLIKSFYYAFSGMSYAFLTQQNFKIHTVALLLVGIAGWCVSLSRTEWLFVLLSAGIVLITELLNTALEVLVDLVSPGFNEKAKIIKDVAAAAVVVSCIFAVVIGLILFLPKFF